MADGPGLTTSEQKTDWSLNDQETAALFALAMHRLFKRRFLSGNITIKHGRFATNIFGWPKESVPPSVRARAWPFWSKKLDIDTISNRVQSVLSSEVSSDINWKVIPGRAFDGGTLINGIISIGGGRVVFTGITIEKIDEGTKKQISDLIAPYNRPKMGFIELLGFSNPKDGAHL
jgi:hypothetical protein